MALKRATHTRLFHVESAMEQVGGRGGRAEAQAARPRGTAPSADLGGSSKYSNKHGALKTEVGKGSMGTAVGHG